MTSPKTTSETEAPQIIFIKKYGNRRFYSSFETRFITLDEIAALVRKGRKVKVTDGETGSDITSEILTQILLEGGRAQHFPVELLEQMIRMNEETLRTFWENYLNQSLRMVLNMQREMEHFYRKVSQKTFASLESFESLNPFLSFWNSADKSSEERHSPPAPEAVKPPAKSPRKKR